MELVVVVAVLLLLISMLVPSLKRAREMAQSGTCQSRLRQLGVAFQAYSSQSGFDGYARPSLWARTGADGAVQRGGWLWPYTGEAELYRCPGDTGERPGGAGSVGPYTEISYVINDHWACFSREWYSFRDVRVPAKTLLLLEQHIERQPWTDYLAWQSEGDGGGPADVPSERHLGGSNILFFDGRVASIPLEQYLRGFPATPNWLADPENPPPAPW
ncbi:MAG: hypothetical protein ACOC93_06130 [Planctomycetota bacterium]